MWKPAQIPQRYHLMNVAAIDQLGHVYQDFKNEIGKVIIGQEDVVERLAICLFSRGHALLMGVPGLAKTLLVSSVAETMDLTFNRIQFTPDLMPADITGTDIIQETSSGHREFEFIQGPVFANLVLADEINRAPAKTQSAMLEAMQENMVTVLGKTYQLDKPFFVLATQNPVEQEGTYPLPEAQLDRFMFLIDVDYPSHDEELRIARETTGIAKQQLNHILNGEQVQQYQDLVRRVPVQTTFMNTLWKSCARPALAPKHRLTGSKNTSAGVLDHVLSNILSWSQSPCRLARILHGALGRHRSCRPPRTDPPCADQLCS